MVTYYDTGIYRPLFTPRKTVISPNCRVRIPVLGGVPPCAVTPQQQTLLRPNRHTHTFPSRYGGNVRGGGDFPTQCFYEALGNSFRDHREKKPSLLACFLCKLARWYEAAVPATRRPDVTSMHAFGWRSFGSPSTLLCQCQTYFYVYL